MSEIEILQNEISLARRELKNIRQEVMKLRANVRDESKKLMLLLSGFNCKDEKSLIKDEDEKSLKMVPIGFISSCFKNKNGIPRQPSLCQSSRASLEINKTYFTNPEHSLIGLSEFSYIWILFVFHKNTESSIKAKVHPPRLNGKSVGVFSTRSPHRPCAIGLSLVKLDKTIGNTLFLSGVDILDGTPVLDIKPYIPFYDTPKLCKNVENPSLAKDIEGSFTSEIISTGSTNYNTGLNSNLKKRTVNIHNQENEKTVVEKNLEINSPATLLKMPSNQLEVLFTERANKGIERFHFQNHENECEYCLQFITDLSAAKQAIIDILQNDPRSVYRRNKCSDKLYYFEIDKLHITCWFDDAIAEVLRIKPVNRCQNSAQ